MSLLNSLIGSAAGYLSNGYQVNPSQSQQNLLSQSMAQQQYQQYQLQNQPQWQPYDIPKWVYNGEPCTLKVFAERMWPDDEQARLLFILKHADEA